MLRLFTTALISISLLSCSPKRSIRHQSEYRAVAIVVVDQLGSDGFSRFTPTSGFKQLTERSSYYPAARYPYLYPETCPGHATIATGTYPKSHGIVSNSWFDRDSGTERYCVDDPKFKRSPLLLKQPALAEILQKQGIKTQTISVSGKDRSAILLAGKNADFVAWYDRYSGNFVTSTFFNPLPSSTSREGLSELYSKFYNRSWYVNDAIQIPYGYGVQMDSSFYTAIETSPAIDHLTFQTFKKLLEPLKPSADSLHVLLLSLSGLDYVGHRYGSASPHYVSALGEVDQILKELLETLDSKYGADRYLLAVTGDHGAFPIELPGTARVSAKQVECARGVSSDSSTCEGVAERICHNSLSRDNKWYDQAKNSYYPGRSAPCFQVYGETLLPDNSPGTSHVTPHPVDTDVPLWTTGMEVQEIHENVSPASIVPTMLSKLGINPGRAGLFDGESLRAIRGGSQ